MAISEDRLQLLLPKRLKRAIERLAKKRGVSVGEYVRRLIEADLRDQKESADAVKFPFGKHPIHTGRRHGSVEHDRSE